MRNKTIDIMKGIAIILMLLGHTGFIYSRFFTCFHMTVFFMISGYLYNQKYLSTFSEFRRMSIKRIYVYGEEIPELIMLDTIKQIIKVFLFAERLGSSDTEWIY